MSKKITYIIFFFIFYIGGFINLNAQVDNNYGQVSNGPVADPGMQLTSDGFHPPTTRKEERLRKKALRISLTNEEVMIYQRKENGRKITFWQSIKYPFIKIKKKKLDKIKAQSNTVYGNKDTSSRAPGYLPNSTKYNLSIKEKDIIDKKDVRNEELTPQEEKLYQKAIKKQNKQKKLAQKFQKTPLSDDEKELLKKGRKNNKTLTPEEKKQLKELKKKQKRNDKITKQIRNYQIDSVYSTGGWLPSMPKKYKLLNLLPKFKKKSPRPSSYVRKIRRINRIYTLSDKEKDALRKRNNGLYLSSFDRLIAERAAVKDYMLVTKSKKLAQQEYIKYQPRESRKRLRKQLKHSKTKH